MAFPVSKRQLFTAKLISCAGRHGGRLGPSARRWLPHGSCQIRRLRVIMYWLWQLRPPGRERFGGIHLALAR